MDPRLTVESMPVRRFAPERWNIRFEGKVIGYVLRKQIGSRARAPWFHEGHVFIDGQDVDIELHPNLDNRCDAILATYLDPMGSVHARYWLRRGSVGGPAVELEIPGFERR
ncbi:hypothetical protein [Microbacterium xylanilyticum]